MFIIGFSRVSYDNNILGGIGFMKGKMAVLNGPKEIQIREFELAKPGPDEVLVEVVRANVCGSDVHTWKGSHPIKTKGTIGHEYVGRIYQLGENVKTDYAGEVVKEGDRVAALFSVTCMKCGPCSRGEFFLCKNRDIYQAKEPEDPPHFFSPFATHCYIFPGVFFYKVPDQVSDAMAAGANCALAQILFSIDTAGGFRRGEKFLVQGAGGLGLYAIAAAKEQGAIVIVIDGIKERLEMAKAFGADYIIDMNEHQTVESRVQAVNELTNGEGADVAIEVTGVPAAFPEGIELIRPGGRYMVLGNVLPSFKVEFSLGLLVRKSITVFPIARYNPWYLYHALKFLERNHQKFPFDSLSSGKLYSLEEINDAFIDSENRKVTRAIIAP
ncbi:MAG: zinc-binding dehydrogenase [Dethiobacteria bacterium]